MGRLDHETRSIELSNRRSSQYVPLVEKRCGKQTAEQIFHRILHKENILYDWLEENPDATKNEIRKKSHEIAGTTDEYALTANKRFYVIQAYRGEVERQSYGAGSFAERMILGANLMCSALEIADELQEYADSKNVYIFERICVFTKVLQGYDVLWEQNKMDTADVSQMDEAGVIALIICATWANRLHPGSIKLHLRNRTIMKWLDRLDELDQ